MKSKVQQFLDRWDLMTDLYTRDYVLRFFHLYDDEMEAVVKALKSKTKRRTIKDVHSSRKQGK